MSFSVEFAPSPEEHDDADNERLDLVDPATLNWSPSSGTFLKAAVTLKDQSWVFSIPVEK
ncbi:hypothetical protein C1H46_027209 [Malus baccata]|uniref:Uncharacterized protein n=1 Tax=Malus baccata TaxID=106549 RepID=A0A540LL89_MALBA|nr:hypothetical protein C1H46_027209 [Malus baccata]